MQKFNGDWTDSGGEAHGKGIKSTVDKDDDDLAKLYKYYETQSLSGERERPSGDLPRYEEDDRKYSDSGMKSGGAAEAGPMDSGKWRFDKNEVGCGVSSLWCGRLAVQVLIRRQLRS